MQTNTDTIRLIRFEDSNGCGPYNPKNWTPPMARKLDQDVYNSYNHPMIEDELSISSEDAAERIGVAGRDIRFAFTSARQRNRWFNARSRQQLREMGARVVVYEAPSSAVIASERQAIFDITRAKRISP